MKTFLLAMFLFTGCGPTRRELVAERAAALGNAVDCYKRGDTSAANGRMRDYIKDDSLLKYMDYLDTESVRTFGE